MIKILGKISALAAPLLAVLLYGATALAQDAIVIGAALPSPAHSPAPACRPIRDCNLPSKTLMRPVG